MNEPKLHTCLVGTGLTWGFAALSWSQVAVCFAIVASLASIWAAIETALWRRKQRKRFEEDDL